MRAEHVGFVEADRLFVEGADALLPFTFWEEVAVKCSYV